MIYGKNTSMHLCILAVLFVFYSSYVYSQLFTNNIDGNLKHLVGYSKSTRSWDEFKKIMDKKKLEAHYLNIHICNKLSNTIQISKGGVRKRVMGISFYFNEYIWTDGKKCVELKNPNLGFLNEEDSRLFYTALDHKNYMKTGLFSGISLYLYKIENYFCSLNFQSKPDPLNPNFLLIKDLCGNPVLNKTPN